MMADIPSTHEQRKLVHNKLLEFATTAVRTGGIKGLVKYLRSFNDARFMGELIVWIEKYTPIQRDRNCTDRLSFRVLEPIRRTYDLGGARLNPYYLEQPIVAKPHRANTTSTDDKKQLSELAFFRKSVHLALDRFLTDGSIESRKRLLELIDQAGQQGRTFKGPIVQGGAPGLGKKS